MGDGNLLSLRWNNHISNFKFTLGQLQQRDLYSDATIACEGHFFPVHKFVLATCSDYFASMFERTPCKHPVIVLKDVSSRDIDFLLSYMYGGEVRVGQTDLPSLIRAAETLQIKGLAAHDDPPSSPHGKKNPPSGSENEDQTDKPSKRPRLENSSSDETNESVPIKEELEDDFSVVSGTDGEAESTGKDTTVTQIPFPDPNIKDVTTENNFFEDGNFPELQVKHENEESSLVEISNSADGTNFRASSRPASSIAGPESESVSWPSSFLPVASSAGLNNGVANASMSPRSNPLCQPNQSTAQDENFPKIETNHLLGDAKPNGSLNHPNNHLNKAGMLLGHSSLQQQQQHHVFRCSLCEYVTHNRSWLDIHHRKHTGEKPFSCPYCSFRSAQRGNLNVHIRKLHSSFSNARAPFGAPLDQQQVFRLNSPPLGALPNSSGAWPPKDMHDPSMMSKNA